jgi:hypothetical protein
MAWREASKGAARSTSQLRRQQVAEVNITEFERLLASNIQINVSHYGFKQKYIILSKNDQIYGKIKKWSLWIKNMLMVKVKSLYVASYFNT